MDELNEINGFNLIDETLRQQINTFKTADPDTYSISRTGVIISDRHFFRGNYAFMELTFEQTGKMSSSIVLRNPPLPVPPTEIQAIAICPTSTDQIKVTYTGQRLTIYQQFQSDEINRIFKTVLVFPITEE